MEYTWRVGVFRIYRRAAPGLPIRASLIINANYKRDARLICFIHVRMKDTLNYRAHIIGLIIHLRIVLHFDFSQPCISRSFRDLIVSRNEFIEITRFVCSSGIRYRE